MIGAVQLAMKPPVTSGISPSSSSSSGQSNFGTFLKEAMDKVNNDVGSADSMASQYAMGGNVSIQQLMISEQKASIAVEMVSQVGQKAISAYQTVMNMQI